MLVFPIVFLKGKIMMLGLYIIYTLIKMADDDGDIEFSSVVREITDIGIYF